MTDGVKNNAPKGKKVVTYDSLVAWWVCAGASNVCDWLYRKALLHVGLADDCLLFRSRSPGLCTINPSSENSKADWPF